MKKKKFSNSKTAWMNSDGEQTEDSDSSFLGFVDEYLDGVKVDLALHANMPSDMVCIDSGCNRLVLIQLDDITEYQVAINRTLGTVDASAILIVAGTGKLGICAEAMQVLGSAANLLPTDLMGDAQCSVEFGKFEDEYYCHIKCHRGVNAISDIKTISARRGSKLWWIDREQLLDILFRGGFTVAETRKMQRFRDSQGAMAHMIAERRLHLSDGSFIANAGETLESADDYAAHYQTCFQQSNKFHSSNW